MKFLIDNNLSPLLADALKAAGHDAVHLRDLGMQAATDDVVLEHARADEPEATGRQCLDRWRATTAQPGTVEINYVLARPVLKRLLGNRNGPGHKPDITG